MNVKNSLGPEGNRDAVVTRMITKLREDATTRTMATAVIATTITFLPSNRLEIYKHLPA